MIQDDELTTRTRELCGAVFGEEHENSYAEVLNRAEAIADYCRRQLPIEAASGANEYE